MPSICSASARAHVADEEKSYRIFGGCSFVRFGASGKRKNRQQCRNKSFSAKQLNFNIIEMRNKLCVELSDIQDIQMQEEY